MALRTAVATAAAAALTAGALATAAPAQAAPPAQAAQAAPAAQAAQEAAEAPQAQAPPGGKDVTAVLFSWTFDSIARACTDSLGPAGYGYVQVSPPQEHIGGAQWWTQYQPVSYRIDGRLGNRDQFRSMVDTCNSAGVEVVADTVINHMTAGSGTGTGGSVYTKYDYPDAPYSDGDFNDCRSSSIDYRDRYQVQNCELVGLSDLKTGKEYVRQRIADYMNDLLSLGVAGFRIDAAKHMPASDLAAIRAKVGNGSPYWKQEAIHGAGEAVDPGEYLGTGDVQEFRYARGLKQSFDGGRLADLRNYGEGWGFMPSGASAVFVDNHDTERVGDTLNHKDGSRYTLANVFMLAWPYGSPDVHSGYEFSDKDAGPPNAGTVNSCYSEGWKCQHDWREIASMVDLRNEARGQSVTDWWDNGNDAVAFGRGSKAFVVINQESGPLDRTFRTSLPAGDYCDVQSGRGVTVDGTGRFTASLGAGTALALHTGARECGGGGPGQPPADSGVSFQVEATTQWGQNVHVAGSCPALGGWDPEQAPALDPAGYPLWQLTVELPAGTDCAYKYLRKDGSGTVQWESGANRSFTVQAGGTVALNDTWRN